MSRRIFRSPLSLLPPSYHPHCPRPADELEPQQGIAHLTEHVAYMGSRKRERLFGTGSQTNAYTDFHHTVFYAACPTATPRGNVPMLPMALDALCDVMEARVEPSRLEKERAEKKRKQEMVESLKQKPHKQPRSIEFFEALKRNEVLKCLNMIKHNPALVGDCDDSRRTPLHWACQLDLTNIIQILVDFNSNLNATDDYARRPLDEALAYSQTRHLEPSPIVLEIYDRFA